MAFAFLAANSSFLSIAAANIYSTPPFSVSVDCMLLSTAGVVFSQLANNVNFTGHYIGFSSNKIAAISANNNTFAISGTLPVQLYARSIITSTYVSTTSRQIFLNGVPGTIDTTSISPALPIANTNVGSATHNVTDNFQSMRVFSVFIWKTALLAGDNALLVRGMPPHLLRAGSIVDGFYFREPIGGLKSINRGFTLTNSNTTFTPELIAPKIYRPQRFTFPALTTIPIMMHQYQQQGQA